MNKHIESLLFSVKIRRYLFFLLSDSLAIIFSLYFSFLLRFDFRITSEWKLLPLALPLFVMLKIASFIVFRLYRFNWSYVGLHEMLNAGYAVIVAEATLMAIILIPMPAFMQLHHLDYPLKGFPRSVFLIDGVITLMLISGLRVSKRVFLELFQSKQSAKGNNSTLIIGAGNTGSLLIRHMEEQGFAEYCPVGFLDDEPSKFNTYIQGVKVLGGIDELQSCVQQYHIKAVIIAIPTLNFKVLTKIYDLAKKSGVKTVKIIPKMYSTAKPDVNLKKFDDIQIEDLIGRQQIEIEHAEIERMLEGNVILVTGAGGSIGAELAIQICSFNPGKVILFDNDETWLHNMQLKLKDHCPHLQSIYYVTGDVRDEKRINEVFEAFYPEIIFHSAAYKHVPMMEHNPAEAIKVNIFGTYLMAKAAVDYGSFKFVMISTDKAVRPTSVMGATKRMAEYICTAFSSEGVTDFISVRFGNVLGSRGSVLHLFLDQLKRGGPITVTHKDMERYFMTIPEAVSLVLQASVIGKGGEVLVLDMGSPVRVVEIAEELIRIHGLEPYKDIDIVFTGMREGEKLFEEILSAEEGTTSTRHDKVFIANNPGKYNRDELELILAEFRSAIEHSTFYDTSLVKKLLKKHIRYYQGA